MYLTKRKTVNFGGKIARSKTGVKLVSCYRMIKVVPTFQQLGPGSATLEMGDRLTSSSSSIFHNDRFACTGRASHAKKVKCACNSTFLACTRRQSVQAPYLSSLFSTRQNCSPEATFSFVGIAYTSAKVNLTKQKIGSREQIRQVEIR
jgi:hypothetical protein